MIFPIKQSQKRGQIALLTIIILGALMSMGMTVVAVFLNESRLVRDNLESVKAVYAADSGLEWMLDNYFHVPARYPDFPPTLSNGASFTTLLVPGDTACVPTATSTRAVGISRGVRRGFAVCIPL